MTVDIYERKNFPAEEYHYYYYKVCRFSGKADLPESIHIAHNFIDENTFLG